MTSNSSSTPETPNNPTDIDHAQHEPLTACEETIESQARGESARFLRAVFIEGSEGYIEVRLLQETARGKPPVYRKWYSTPERFIDDLPKVHQIAKEHAAGIFFGVLPRAAHGVGKAADVRPARILWADIDFKDFAGGEDEVIELLKLLNVPPSIIIRSGHGLHVYWLLSETADPDRIERTNEALARVLRADRAFDRARVLRLPGTLNYKDPAKPIRTTIEKLDANGIYALSVIEEAIKVAEGTAQEARNSSTSEQTPLLGTAPQTRSESWPGPVPAAGLSDGVRALVDRVKKVRDAYLGQGKPESSSRGRPLDRSSSGYDFTFLLLLARHGVRERVELARALAARPDGGAAGKGGAYIGRTVDSVLALVVREEAGDAGDPSEEMDFTVERVVIFASNPPAYVFLIDGVELELDAGDILNPGTFTKRFLEALHRVPQLPDPGRHPWAKVVNSWLSKAEKVEQPPEASSEGALREAVEHVIRNLTVGEESSDLDRGAAVLLPDARIAFRVAPLFEAVREELPDAKRQHVCRVLRELGYAPEHLRLDGHPQRIWSGAQYARTGGGHAIE